MPTPAPDAGDFMSAPVSPWLPTKPATVETTGGMALTVTPLSTTDIAGITVVPVELAAGPEGRRGRWVRWLAVDLGGNIWLLGEEASGVFGDRDWQVGEAGALAGLVVPAHPRRGDGFLAQRVPGGPRDRVSTVRVAASDPAYAESCPGCVEFQVSDRTGRQLLMTYQSGVGLLRLIPLGGWPPDALPG